MADAILTEVLKTVAVKVGSEACKRIVSAADIDSQIRELRDLKSSIEAALLDADSAQTSTSHSERDVLEKLERGLDKLIDFQDAKATKAKQKEVMGGSKLTKEVRLFFSSSNQIVSPFKDANKLKGIANELSLAARNHAQFGTIVSSSSVNKHRTLINDSGSFTSTDMIIGRDGDRDYMVNSLLESSAAAGILSVASIVGIGGVGKTTLAQYVYNDDRIQKYFDLQLWVSNTQEFNVKDVLRKILACATDEEPRHCEMEMDQLQRRLFRAIAGKKFMLVLDGVWDSDDLTSKWIELRTLLRFGGQGSKVLITTRSDTVARMMGTQEPYMVSDLGDDDSWLLFQHVATTEGQEPGVEAIGKEIAKMCPKVPLVIRAIGSLLARKHTVKEWHAFRNDQLTNFTSYGRDVMSTLKLSYDHLDAGLKPCVAYCSLFPKGFYFEKSHLVHLWIAMGYVEAKYENQSLEDAAEEYVLCLFEQGFFYGMKRKGYGCPDSFQMHNLMHDLVLSIAGFKYKMADLSTTEFDERVCHVSYNHSDTPWTTPSSLFKIKQLKSFLLPLQYIASSKFKIHLAHDIFISRVRSLRVLRMHKIGINKLPRSLGELIHLRYLDFSFNPIRKLPDSITQLVNLYLLDLFYCERLEELPKDISKLVMLKHLYLRGCDNLSHMPKELLRLTGLETLDHFAVGKPRNSLSLNGSNGELVCCLADLSQLNNLKGKLTINVVDRSQNIVSEAKAANLDRKEITDFLMKFRESKTEDEMVLDNLKPGASLEYLKIQKYGGQKLPCWMREGIHLWLPNLVDVTIFNCESCIHMCSFGRLPHLKNLTLKRLAKVEYIENGSSNNNNDKTTVLADEHPCTPLFPSLEDLWLIDIPKLKGWWSITDSAQDQGMNELLKCVPAFPKLDQATMDMEVLISLAKTSFPGFSSLKCLCVYDKDKAIAEQTSLPSNVTAMQKQPLILLKSYLPKLLELEFDGIETESLPQEFRGMSSLKTLDICKCEALEGIPEWIDSLTSLKTLSIYNCPRVESLPHEIGNLPDLKTLGLYKCSRQLEERCKEITGEDWPKIQHIPDIRIIPANDDESRL